MRIVFILVDYKIEFSGSSHKVIHKDPDAGRYIVIKKYICAEDV